MLRILLTTARPEAFHSFSETLLSDSGVRLHQVASGAEALSAVRASSPNLVVIDSDLPDAKPLDLVMELLKVNAMVNTVVVSPLPEEEFHEASEGLGVLGRLPVEPGENDALEMLGKLRKVLGQLG
jgi:DNA-binding response OmpR family regulator